MIVTRNHVVVEARSWIRTPYHSRARVKGHGVDCGFLPYCVYRKFDLVPESRIDHLSDQWWEHTTEERYLVMIERVLKQLVETAVYRDVPQAKPGNLILTRAAKSRVYNHAGIVTDWPMIVHSFSPEVREVDGLFDPTWSGKQIVIYDPWERVA